MKKEIKEAIENLIAEKESLQQKNQSLFKDNQRLRLDLDEAYTTIRKFGTVLNQLIIAISYSEDEKNYASICASILMGSPVAGIIVHSFMDDNEKSL